MAKTRQQQLDEDVEAIRQLVEETSITYGCYISIFSFSQGPACLSSDPKVGQ
jgi:hypothetical protein